MAATVLRMLQQGYKYELSFVKRQRIEAAELARVAAEGTAADADVARRAAERRAADAEQRASAAEAAAAAGGGRGAFGSARGQRTALTLTDKDRRKINELKAKGNDAEFVENMLELEPGTVAVLDAKAACAAQLAAAREALEATLSELRPDVVALVDAFDQSDYQLDSAIGRADGQVYEALWEHAQRATAYLCESGPGAAVDGWHEAIRPTTARGASRL